MSEQTLPIFDKIPHDEIRSAFLRYQEVVDGVYQGNVEEVFEDLRSLNSLVSDRFSDEFIKSCEESEIVESIHHHITRSINYCFDSGLKCNIFQNHTGDPFYSWTYIYQETLRGKKSYAYVHSLGPFKDFELMARPTQLGGLGILEGVMIPSVEETTLALIWMLVNAQQYLIGISTVQIEKTVKIEKKYKKRLRAQSGI